MGRAEEGQDEERSSRVKSASGLLLVGYTN